MHHRKSLDPKLLAAYIAGSASVAQAEEVHNWVAADLDRAALLKRLNDAATDVEPEDLDTNKLLRSVSAEISGRRSGEYPGHVSDPRTRTARQGWRSAYSAVALSVSLVAIGLFTVISNPFATTDQPVLGYWTYSTELGQQSSVSLPDGSKVLLNVGSTLRVPTDYAIGNRQLQLSGSAVFTVVSHSSQPFTVESRNSMTRVLGTKFLVKDYEQDNNAMVAVRAGKVSVDGVVLQANERVMVADNNPSEKMKADSTMFSFEDGVMQLQNIKLKDAIADLNRWYNSDIVLGVESLGDEQVTGGFSQGSLTDLTSFLELTFNVRVVRNGRTLTLFPNK